MLTKCGNSEREREVQWTASHLITHVFTYVFVKPSILQSQLTEKSFKENQKYWTQQNTTDNGVLLVLWCSVHSRWCGNCLKFVFRLCFNNLTLIIFSTDLYWLCFNTLILIVSTIIYSALSLKPPHDICFFFFFLLLFLLDFSSLCCVAFVTLLCCEQDMYKDTEYSTSLQTPSSSSVQFSSRWYLCTQKSPYVLQPISQ